MLPDSENPHSNGSRAAYFGWEGKSPTVKYYNDQEDGKRRAALENIGDSNVSTNEILKR